jgi:hypothetical protein
MYCQKVTELYGKKTYIYERAKILPTPPTRLSMHGQCIRVGTFMGEIDQHNIIMCIGNHAWCNKLNQQNFDSQMGDHNITGQKHVIPCLLQ